jgi:hypothetical protein
MSIMTLQKGQDLRKARILGSMQSNEKHENTHILIGRERFTIDRQN